MVYIGTLQTRFGLFKKLRGSSQRGSGVAAKGAQGYTIGLRQLCKVEGTINP